MLVRLDIPVIVYENECISSCRVYAESGRPLLMPDPDFGGITCTTPPERFWFWRYTQERIPLQCNILAIDVCFAQETSFPLWKRRCDASIRVLRPYIWNFRYVYLDIDILCLEQRSYTRVSFGY